MHLRKTRLNIEGTNVVLLRKKKQKKNEYVRERVLRMIKAIPLDPTMDRDSPKR